jgi:hypothetical protein
LAGTIVVSARTLSSFMSLARLAFFNNASFSSLIAAPPQRLVIFSKVEASGTAAPIVGRHVV